MSTERPAIPAELRRQILVEAGHRCAIQTCRAPDVDVHHIEPWHTRKTHDLENLIALCPNCHRRADRGEIDRKSLLHYKRICQQLARPPLPVKGTSTYIKFLPNSTDEILDSSNISSLTDNEILDFTFGFAESFRDERFIIRTAATGNVRFVILSQTTHSVRLRFEHPCPEVVRLEFLE